MTRILLAGIVLILLAAAAWAPQWLVFLLALALAKGLVVLGLLLLMRTGLVSFGQGLYFGLGAYAAALLAHRGGLDDALFIADHHPHPSLEDEHELLLVGMNVRRRP